MRLKSRSTWWYAAAALVIAGALLLMVRLVLFLVGQTLGDADSWMSVAGGLTALVGVTVGSAGWLLHRGREVHDDETGSAGRIAGWEAARQAYGTAVRRRYQNIDLEVLTPLSEQDEHPPLRIGEIFVGQLVKTDPPAVELPRELMLRLAQDDPQDVRDLPPGVDQNLLAEVRRAYTQRPPAPVLDLLTGEGTRLVLLGDPGSGKTTLTKYVVYTLSGQVPPTDPLAALAGWLPLLVELRAFSRVLNADPVDAFGRYWQQRHAEGTGLPPDELMEYLRNDGRAVVFFDGLDEVFEPGLRDLAERHIVGFADAHPRARVVVTSRPVGYQGDDLRAAGFAKAKIQDLDEQQVREFVTRWFQVTCRTDPAQGEHLAARLLKAVSASSAVAEIAGNPMLLTILAIIGRRRALPRDRSSVFEHAVTVMVEHWDPSKFLNQELPSANLPYLDATDKLELLRLVARRMQDSPAGLSGNFISGQDLITEFADFLRERDPSHVSLDRAKQAAASMIQQFRSRNFILSRFGGNVYGFVHRSFLEYLAAADIVDRFHRTRELTEDQLVEDVFLRRWRDPAWQEVLLLITGMLGENTAERCVLALLGADPRWAVRYDDPPAHLVLAGRCLAEVRRLSRMALAGPATFRYVIHALEVLSLRERTDLFGWNTSEAAVRGLVRTVAGLGNALVGWEGYLSWFQRRASDLAHAGAVNAAVLANVYRTPGEATDHVVEFAYRHASFDVRRRAIEELKTEHRRPGPLTELCGFIAHERSLNVRVAAVSLIGAAWKGEPEALPFLRRVVTGDRHSLVRVAAVEAMVAGWPGDPAVFEVLRESALDEEDNGVRAAAVSAIGSAWQAQPDARLLVRRIALEGKDPGVSAIAVQALDAGWRAYPDTLPFLNELAVGAGEPSVRAAAVTALAARGGLGDLLGFLRRLAVDETSSDLRGSAVSAIGEGWPDEPGTLSLMAQVATCDPDERVRSAATSLLGRCGRNDPEVLASLHRIATDDGGMLVRLAAMRAMVEGWPTHPDTVPMLCDRAAHNDNWWTQAQAVEMMAVGWRGDGRTHSVLRMLSTSKARAEPTESVGTTLARMLATRALAAGWFDDERTLVMLRTLAMDGNGLNRDAAIVLLSLGWWHDENTVVQLNDIAEAETGSARRGIARAALAVAASARRAVEGAADW